jgi:hypothetical protein
MIAGTAKADRGIVVGNRTDAIAFTHYAFTRAIHQGFLTSIAMQCKSIVTDTDRPLSAKRTAPVVAAVEPQTWIRHGNAILTLQVVAFVTNTQRLVCGGHYTKTVVTTVNFRTWIGRHNAILTLQVVTFVTNTQRLVCGGHYTKTIVTTVNFCTWTRHGNATVAIEVVSLVTDT